MVQIENKQQQCSVAPSLCWLLLFPLHLNIRGLWTPIGPGKLFMGVLESPEFLVSKRVGTLISVCNQPPVSTQPFIPLGLVYLTSFAVDFLSISVRTLWSFCWTYVTAYRHHCLTNMSVWRIRNCCAYSKPVTSHAFSGLAGSRRTLLHMQRADVMATVLQVWRQIRNQTPSIDAYLLEEQSCQILPRYDLKEGLRVFEKRRPNKNKNDE